MAKKKKVIIIGSGIAGLATSIRLAAQGFDVEVFEANAYPGGKLSELRLGKYRFDAGPSLFTMPQLVEELYELTGRDPSDFSYIKKDVTCNYFWEDGTSFSAFADKNKFSHEVESKLGVPGKIIDSYLQKSSMKYDRVGSIFLEKSLHRISTWLNFKVFKALLHLPSFDLYRSMNSVNERDLKDKKLVQLFNRYATYNGSDPYQTPGLLSMIPHLEFNIGTFFPAKGMHQITESLFLLAKEQGVRFHFNQKVDSIEVRNKRVEGVTTSGVTHKADLVVSNMDVHPTYTHLLKKEEAPQKTLKQERSSSAIIFYWGIKQKFSQLDLHNIFFSEDYRSEFLEIFQKGGLHADPTVYINITSKNNPQDAPQGGENWFILVNAPANSGQNWDQLINECRKNVLKKLSRILNVDIESLIEEEEVLDPRKIESKTSSYQGSLYGTSSNNKFAAFLRHKNFSSKIAGLYFCGGSVHPGGGIPLCLNSAKIVDQLIRERENK